MFRSKRSAQVPVEKSVREGVAYCPNCGGEVTDYYHIGEVVLVEPSAGRPFYAQLINIMNDAGMPTAIVGINSVETAKVPLATLRKVFT